jgi:hypothetical protein
MFQCDQRGERGRKAGQESQLKKMSTDGVLCPLSPLNLVTPEYMKKYYPYIYDFVYTPVIIPIMKNFPS